MKRSESTAKIAGALAKAQGRFKRVLKNQGASYPAKGGMMSYDFADLEAHLAAVRKPLAANGIALLTPTRNEITRSVDDRGYAVATGTAFAAVRLEHESGEWMESEEFTIPIVDGLDARSVGSAATYARKYAVQGFLGIHPAEEDDDGEAARGGDHDQARAPVRQPQAQQQRQQAPQRPTNEPQRQPQRAPAQRQQPDQPETTEGERSAALARSAEEKQRADDIAARDLDLFNSAVAVGIAKEGFHAWAEKIIGRPYATNTDWTEADREHLRAEVATLREFGGKGPAQLAPSPAPARGKPKLVPVDTVKRSIPVTDERDGTTRTATVTVPV